MTGQRATPREIAFRIAKMLVFLIVVGTLVIVLGVSNAYMVGMWTAAAVTSAFPLVYSAVAPWWRYALGRVIFGSVASVALLIDFTLWRVLTPTHEWWIVYVGSLLWASLAYHIGGLTKQLILAQHRGRSRNLDGSRVD